MRRLSSGLQRYALSCTLKLRGFKLAGFKGAGALRVQLPAALTRLLGWRVGHRLQARASARGVQLSASQVPSALHAMVPRKRSGADRVRFQRRWQQALRRLRREPKRRLGSIARKTKGMR
jgi:hypothetical protein